MKWMGGLDWQQYCALPPHIRHEVVLMMREEQEEVARIEAGLRK